MNVSLFYRDDLVASYDGDFKKTPIGSGYLVGEVTFTGTDGWVSIPISMTNYTHK